MLTDKSRFRLRIFKSKKHIYAILIDDSTNKIITSCSTISKDIKDSVKKFKNCETAKIVGKHMGIKLKDLGITKIVFDRGRNLYHGQIESIAEGTREEGIIF